MDSKTVGVRRTAIEEVNRVLGGASSGRTREKLRAFSVEGVESSKVGRLRRCSGCEMKFWSFGNFRSRDRPPFFLTHSTIVSY